MINDIFLTLYNSSDVDRNFSFDFKLVTYDLSSPLQAVTFSDTIISFLVSTFVGDISYTCSLLNSAKIKSK